MTYIEREALLEELIVIFEKTDPEGAEQIGVLQCLRALRKAPVVDLVSVKHGLVSVKHGRWIDVFDKEWGEANKCSCCGFESYGLSINHYGYCPNCGAKMDLED